MTIHILGTSNSIMRDSFLDELEKVVGQPIANHSIGSSSAAVSLYLHDEWRIQPGDIFILDYIINDMGYLNLKLLDPDTLALHLSTAIAAIRKSGATPFSLLLPSIHSQQKQSTSEATHIQVCQSLQVPYFNFARIFRNAMLAGMPESQLMRDPAHMSANVTPRVGQIIGNGILEYINAPQTIKSIAHSWLPFRRIPMTTLIGESACITRRSSLREASYGLLKEEETLNIPIGDNELLTGIMINTGAPGAKIKLAGDGTPTIKPCVIYWDANRPDIYTAILVGFREPIKPNKGQIQISIQPNEATATEPTLNAKPTLPGRYGEIEIEGFLIQQQTHKPVTIEFSAPAEWQLDLLSSTPEGPWAPH